MLAWRCVHFTLRQINPDTTVVLMPPAAPSDLTLVNSLLDCPPHHPADPPSPSVSSFTETSVIYFLFYLVPYMFPENSAFSMKSPLSMPSSMASLLVKW